MRYLVGLLLILCFVGLIGWSVGCGKFCTQIACMNAVEVELVPEIEATYDVTLVFDGEAEAFTCVRSYDELREDWVWRPQPLPGPYDCDGEAFTRRFDSPGAVPESVEITVNAEDGSWNGSITTSPAYEVLQPNGPDCPPTCRFARVTIANEVDTLEVRP